MINFNIFKQKHVASKIMTVIENCKMERYPHLRTMVYCIN